MQRGARCDTLDKNRRKDRQGHAGGIRMSLGVNLGKNKPFEEVEGNFLKGLADYYRHPDRYYLEPFRIAGNLYYVGDKKVCSHLLATEEGLILFDSGYQHAAHQLFFSIQRLGFSPGDVRLVIHSHGHFDHFGAGDAFRGLCGSTLCLSRADAERLRVNPRAALWSILLSPTRRCWSRTGCWMTGKWSPWAAPGSAAAWPRGTPRARWRSSST